MSQINRLDATTWPVGWTPDSRPEAWAELGSLLRKARSLATELRVTLDAARDEAHELWTVYDGDMESWLDNLEEKLSDQASEAGDLESWLDDAPIEGEKDPFILNPEDWV